MQRLQCGHSVMTTLAKGFIKHLGRVAFAEDQKQAIKAEMPGLKEAFVMLHDMNYGAGLNLLEQGLTRNLELIRVLSKVIAEWEKSAVVLEHLVEPVEENGTGDENLSDKLVQEMETASTPENRKSHTTHITIGPNFETGPAVILELVMIEKKTKNREIVQQLFDSDRPGLELAVTLARLNGKMKRKDAERIMLDNIVFEDEEVDFDEIVSMRAAAAKEPALMQPESRSKH